MKSANLYRFLFVGCLLVVVYTTASALLEKHREYSRSKEKELRVLIDVSFGSITIERISGDKIAVVDYEEDETDKHKLFISYDINNETGTLRIKLKESSKLWGKDDNRDGDRRKLVIGLTTEIPISFDIELGAGTGEINLTNLQVKDMKISTGASSVTMKCGKPNPILADEITIESGVSKFTATDLGNLNFRNLKFSGGVGSYKLDFSGKYYQSGEAEVEVGLGSINIYLPKYIPAKLVYDDNWLSSFSLDDDFEKKRKGVYETEDFREAFKRLTIKLSSGLGSVKVQRK